MDKIAGDLAPAVAADIAIEDDSVSLLEAVVPLAEHWKLLVFGPLAIGLAAFGIAFLLPPIYTATTTLLPPQQQQSSASSLLSSLGSLAGLAGGGAAGLRTPADQYVALMQSASVSDRMIDQFKLLDVYDQQLTDHGQYVFEQRRLFLQKLLPLVNQFYEQIAGSNEQIGLAYESALLQTGLADLLRQRRNQDLLMQRTTQGIHRDDLIITLREQPFKTTASQGQRKSLLFALKLAEYEMLKQYKGFPPLLLLDDVFEKLDAHRMHNLLDKVCLQNQGQIFITDTHGERIRYELDKLNIPSQIIAL